MERGCAATGGPINARPEHKARLCHAATVIDATAAAITAIGARGFYSRETFIATTIIAREFL